jgi:hypothetical protein
LHFSVDKFELLNQSEDSQLSKMRMWIVSEGNNKHNLPISWDAIVDAKKSLVGKPVLCSYNKYTDQFQGHEEDEVPIGVFMSEEDIYEDNIDGKRWIYADCIIWKKYFPNVISVLQKQNGNTNISMEIELLEQEDDESVKLFSFNGVTLIGIEPAIPGSKGVMLKFSDMVEETKKILREEFANRYGELDFTIPPSVKKNAKKSLELNKQHNLNLTSVALSNARYISNNDVALPDKVRSINKFLCSNKTKEKDSKIPDKNYVAWMAHGGNDAFIWSNKLVESMDEIDNKKLSFFGDVITFPYKSIGDINPSLKGINPPITLSQANEIAKQADSIGADKGGWGIAIKSFKNRYKVVGGEWVTKEKFEESEVKEETNMPREEIKEEEFVEETPEEKKETPADEEKEEAKEQSPMKEEEKEEKKEEDKKMSLDSNLDVSATLSFLESETEVYGEMEQEFSKPADQINYAKVCAALVSKIGKMSESMVKMESDGKAYMAENEELRKFKAEVEERQFVYAVESALKEVEEFMPKEKMSALREQSKEFSLSNIDGFVNAVKAEAFTFSKQKITKDGVVRMGLPFSGKSSDKSHSSLWG